MSHIVRKNRSSTLILSGALIVAAAAGSAVSLNGVAHAAPPTLGTLTFNPSSGGDQAPIRVTTTTGCSDPNADSVFMTVIGPIGSASLTFDHFNIITTTNNGFSKSDPIDVGFDNDLVSEAGNNGTQLQTGEYDFDLVCTNSQTLENLGDFTGVINVDETAHTYTAQGGTSTTTPTSTQPVTPSSTATPTATTTQSQQPSATDTSAPPSTDTSTSTISSGGGADTSAPADSGSTDTSAQTGNLANTGFQVGLFSLLGLIVLLAGLVLIVLQRRRKSASRDGL